VLTDEELSAFRQQIVLAIIQSTAPDELGLFVFEEDKTTRQ
jgi:hypothetical protein